MLRRKPVTEQGGLRRRDTVAAAKPHHIGRGCGLVDEHQPGRIKHALLSHPAPTRAGHVGALLLRCAQAFLLKPIPGGRKRQTALPLPAIRRLRIAATTSSSIKFIQSQIRLLGNHSRQPVRVLLQWRRTPAVGLAATLAVACQRCSHLIAELAPTSKRSAASPPRRPKCYGVKHTLAQVQRAWFRHRSLHRINAARLAHARKIGNRRFNSAEIALAREIGACGLPDLSRVQPNLGQHLSGVLA